MSKVLVESFPFDDARDSQWARLIAFLEEVPVEERLKHPCTEFMNVSLARVDDGSASLTEARDELQRKVERRAANHAAAKEQLKEFSRATADAIRGKPRDEPVPPAEEPGPAESLPADPVRGRDAGG